MAVPICGLQEANCPDINIIAEKVAFEVGITPTAAL